MDSKIALIECSGLLYDFLKRDFMPSVRDILREANPKLFSKWGENCCRQGSIAIQQNLTELFPDVKWRVFESTFKYEDTTFEHAWVLGEIDESRYMVVDVTSNNRNSIYHFSNSEVVDFKEFRPYAELGIVEIHRQEMSIKLALELTEYFTSLPGYELMDVISDRVKSKKDALREEINTVLNRQMVV